jgi:molybdopterin molybdotransferase
MLGAARPLPLALLLPVLAPLPANGSRREFVRAAIEPAGLRPVSLQDSGALSALAATDALIDRPAHAPAVEAGTQVSAYLLENGGLA